MYVSESLRCTSETKQHCKLILLKFFKWLKILIKKFFLRKDEKNILLNTRRKS